MASSVPIAIIGMSCKFAGDATDPEKLYKICAEGRSAWSRIPHSRFNVDGLYHPNGEKADTTNVVGGHFLEEDIALFDAGFFNFPSELAASLDPQFRLQLEGAFEAFESAGLSMQDVAGTNTSVYGGAFFQDYSDAHVRDTSTLPRSLLLGVGSAMASNRLSHFFDLRGPSMSIDTGCSTTLTAFHQACQSLRTGESDMSLIGGANVIFNPDNFIIMSSLKFLSPEGKSFAFDSRASGYGRGEGSASIVIKRLDDAIRDGDPVRAVILTSAVNQDGRTETITSPSQEAQAALIRKTYDNAGLDPAETSYFEAHGTGTPTGDPIEVAAISSVFTSVKSPERPLFVGSVKSNIGHTETASGLAALIKVALAMEKGFIPPNATFEEENKSLRLAERHLKVPTQLEAWPDVDGVRRASVNNFGYGGSNAHVIMESFQSFLVSQRRRINGALSAGGSGDLFAGSDLEVGNSPILAGGQSSPSLNHVDTASSESGSLTDSQTDVSLFSGKSQNKASIPLVPAEAARLLDRMAAKGLSSNVGLSDVNRQPRSKVVVLSGKDEQAALAVAANLKIHLEDVEAGVEGTFLDSLAYTLGQRRSVLPWVAAAPVGSTRELIKALDEGNFKPTRTSSRPNVGFVFTGQGAQWFAMGRELIDAYPVFKETILEADLVLAELGSTWSLMDELMKDAAVTRVNEIALSTPMSCVVQIALVRLLKSWGVTPRAVTSHSSGEIGAAYAAGAISLRSAITICFARGTLAGKPAPGATKGGMIAVGLGADDTAKYIARLTAGDVVVACYNSPSSTTASGDAAAIDELEGLLKQDNIFARRLKIDAAYHSHHMKPIADPYLAWLSRAIQAEDKMDRDVIFASPTTGKRETSGLLVSGAQHWVDSLTRPVQFIQAFRNMCFDESSPGTSAVDVVIEIGPHAALSGPIQEIVGTADFKSTSIKYFPTLIRKSSAVDTMQDLAANLLRAGHSLDMGEINSPFGQDGLRVIPDLPTYPWNHQVRHWSEARVNKAYRSRGDAPHDLLGVPVPGSNSITPIWRLNVRLADLPWLRDHVVQGNVLYPGAGFICMAIEAVAQLGRAENKNVVGYQLRDVELQQALVVPETEHGVEVQLSFSPTSDKAIYAQGWKEFRICSVSPDNKWSEHCKGLINVEADSAGDDKTRWRDPHAALRLVPYGEDFEYWMRMDPADVYADMRFTGIHHGPVFQNMTGIRTRPSQSVTDFEIADIVPHMPAGHQSPHVLHPTTLDTLFQSTYGAYIVTPESGGKLVVPLVPRSIKSLSVAHDLPVQARQTLRTYCNVTRASAQGCTCDLVLFDGAGSPSTAKPVLTVDGFVVESIGTAVCQDAKAFDHEKLSVVQWTPDITFAKAQDLKQQLATPFDPVEGDVALDLRRACIHLISDTLAALSGDDIAQLEWHHKRYYAWMKLQLTLANQDGLAPQSSGWIHDNADDRARLLEKVKAASVNGEMVCQLARQMLPILKRETTPLEVMMEDKLLHTYYIDAMRWDRSERKLGELVKMIALKKPRAKILEIGGGTGGATRHVLEALGKGGSSGGGPLAASYDFTDISSGFFEAAQEKFSDWKNLVRYKKLDIEQDPAKQGFEEGSYDLIVACQVLHATKNMTSTMENVRRLLKPGGKLALMETTNEQLDLSFVFGLLPGWWLSQEEDRKWSPNMPVTAWDQVLSKTGFNGVELEVHDCEDEDTYMFSVMMATALPAQAPRLGSGVTIVTGEEKLPASWLTALSEALGNITGSTPSVESLEEVHAEGKVCVFVGELTHPVLRDPTAAQFSAIKAMCTQSKGTLWLTRGAVVDSEDPDVSLSQGFLRTTRVEYAGKRMAVLDLDPQRAPWDTGCIESLARVYTQVFDYSPENPAMDLEFAERDGVIHVPRYFQDVARNKALYVDSTTAYTTSMEPFHQADRPLRLGIGTPGLLDTLVFRDNVEAQTELPDDYVEIAPKAFGVNFRDVMVAMGQLESDTMGFECAGVVQRVGFVAASRGFQPGDRVTTLLRAGHFANLVRTEWSNAVRIPDDMSFETAATIPMIFATAYISLFDMAKLQRGDKILIHTATGGVGQAAIMLAQHVGAEVFATAGTDKKRNFIMNRYGIAADHVFSSRDTSFAAGIMTHTQGTGVDVVLNSLAGPLLQASFDCTARFGRFVEIGKRDLEQDSSLALGAFTRNVSFSSLDLLQYEQYRGADVHRVMNAIIALFAQKAITTAEPVTVYPLTDLEKTFRLMQGGKHLGKIVVTVDPDAVVPVIQAPSVAKLRPDASYLIVGGLGGIGRSICHWMAERGAENVIVLSRSANQDKARSFIDGMAKKGCKVKAVGCDIADEQALAAALESCAQDMPPIRGVIQAAMVLQDSILEQMSVEQYRAAVRPKVHGSWNLHRLLHSTQVDFFVMLSSLSGVVGFASQCSYAAGNTYQDALARHRTCQGLHGASIDLGAIKLVGYLAENQSTMDRVTKTHSRVSSEDDVLKAIESAIVSSPRGQMMLGLNDHRLPEHEDRFTPLRFRPQTDAAAGSGSSASNKAGSTSAGDLGGQISAASTLEDATQAVVRGITTKLADIFMIEAAEIAPSNSVAELGVDSLVAVELRNMLALRAGAEVSIFDIMQSPGIAALAAKVAAKSSYLDPSLLPSP